MKTSQNRVPGRRLLLSAAFVLLAGCGRPAPAPVYDEKTAEVYSLEGTIAHLDLRHRTASIKHGPITNKEGKVWMEPMTMDFPVPHDSDWVQLATGLKIRARLFARSSDFTYWIANVRRVGPAVSEAQP